MIRNRIKRESEGESITITGNKFKSPLNERIKFEDIKDII